jgi:hypothetical protein
MKTKRVTRREKLRIKVVNLKSLAIKKLNLKDPKVRKKFVKHLGKVGIACFSLAVTTSLYPVAATAIDNSTIAINNEAGKTVLNEALKVSRTKPTLSIAAAIVCLACVPVTGLAVSPAMCIACGILITKVIG